jgi:SAM-dependent methyltransferase
VGKFWCRPDGKDSDRTVKQQLTGLDQLWPRVRDKTVIDVGCAEGVVAFECLAYGAAAVLGVEMRQPAVHEANRKAERECLPFLAKQADANTWAPPTQADVILLLAILHKLAEPAQALDRFLAAGAGDNCTVVLRTRRRDWPVLRDARSGMRPQRLDAVLHKHGFTLVHEDDGPVCDGQPAEWVGVFEKGAHA